MQLQVAMLAHGPHFRADSPASPSLAVPARDEWAPHYFKGCAMGTVLVVTNDLPLVLSLRHDLLAESFHLMWTNNFWVAMSYLHENVFAGLVLDLRVESIEEKFIPFFLEEYRGRSRGALLVLPSAATPPALQRLLGRLDLPVVLRAAGACSVGEIVQALAEGEAGVDGARSTCLEAARADYGLDAT